jgi:hypothetical protein
MLVDEWIETVWIVLNVRAKISKAYKHLYKSHLKPVIGLLEIDSVFSKNLQVKLTSLPLQTAG